MGRSRQGGGASALRIAGFEREDQGRCGQGRRGLFSTTALVTRRAVLALALAAVLWPQGAGANPDGGTVVGGAAAIVQTSPNRLDIMQATDRVIIDWRSFSIGEAEHTNFAQPSTDSVALNRVTGGDLSTIAGRLSANGNIVLINPNGVIFTSTARVDVRGLIASTSNIGNEDFMAGRLNFSAAANPSSFVINRGEITAAEGGLVALVAPWVENSGVIAARLGRVELASGGAFTVDLYGDGLIQLALAETGEVAGALASEARVSNLGLISADGGVVALTVADARNLVDSVINMEGIIEARTVEQSAGRIVLNGGDAGIVRVSGTLDASGRDAGEIGGQVTVLGEKVGLFDGAVVDVSGDAGGGTALIGGNYQGAGPERNAQFTYLSSGMRIDADAITQGDGGTVIVWADQGTRFEGTITARGGAESGDGGFVEVSGKGTLAFRGSVDLSAANGANGTLLLDPNNITIVPDDPDGFNINITLVGDTFETTGDASFLEAGSIVAALTTGNVIIETGIAAPSSEAGDIIIQTLITAPANGNSLTLLAHDDIIFEDFDATFFGRIDFSASTGTLSLLADGISSDGVGAIINNSSASFVIEMDVGQLLLVAGSGIGTAANPFTLEETDNATIAGTTTNSGGIFLEADFNNDLVIGTVGATVGLISAGDVSIVNLEGSITILQDIVAGGAVTINATIGDVLATADIFAGGNAGFIDIDGDIVTLARLDTLGVADSGIADSGDVNVDGRFITVTGTIFTGGGDG
ncbi:MAG: filamentous hemagglutinin N-terminal domain-containing protein, partial [Proteobacteria bacterium]|nr:filamentous hemagglutinin N-terminal domain-containing protein [Pseudomonadota bacterium]